MSFGDNDSLDLVHITHIELMFPKQESSKYKGYWAGMIQDLMEDGWRITYTDGTGRKEWAAAAVVSRCRRDRGTAMQSSWLGNVTTVADAERKPM